MSRLFPCAKSIELMSTPDEVWVYCGPSRPPGKFPDFIRFHPPAQQSDFRKQAIPDNAITVLVDGLFFQSPAVTHFDLLDLLADKRVVMGASSMGALRAVELRHQGMIGIGTIYSCYLNGVLRDDGEVAEAVCPYTFAPLSIPTVRIRRALALLALEGVDREDLDTAFWSAHSIHFFDRSMDRLRQVWSRSLPANVLAQLADISGSPESDIKALDAQLAIAVAANQVAPSCEEASQGAVDIYVPTEHLGGRDDGNP